MRDLFIQFGVDIIKFSTSATIAMLFVIYMVLEKEPPPSVRMTLQFTAGAIISAILVPLFTTEVLEIKSNAYTAMITGIVVYSFPKVLNHITSIFLNKLKDKENGGS